MTINGGAHRDGDSVAARKKSLARGKWVGLLTLALAPLVVMASPGVASAASSVCLENSDGSQTDIAGNSSTPDKTRSLTTQSAGNTWEDWIWRGPTFKCPTNVPSCSYAWQQSKTTSWKVSVGLSIKVPIPYVGKLFDELTPSYDRGGSTTTSYTFTTNLKPGQYAQPIQVVQRRWTKGTYVGIYHSTGKRCTSSPSNPNHNAYFFTWSPNERYGSWTTNLRVNDYGTYNVYS